MIIFLQSPWFSLPGCYWATSLVCLVFCGRDFEADVAESSKHLWGHEVQTQGYMEITKSFCWIQGLLVECGLGPTSDFRVIISWISPCRFQIWDLHWFGWTLSDLTIPDLKWATRCKFLVPSTHAQQTADTSTNFVAKLVPELLLPQWNDRGPMHSWGVFKTLHWWLSLG